MKITVKESKGNPSYFFAYLDGRRICCSRTPFFTSARIFKRAGVSDDEPLEMYHEGKDYVCLKSTVGYAAKWTILENARVGPLRILYKPFRRAENTTTSSP